MTFSFCKFHVAVEATAFILLMNETCVYDVKNYAKTNGLVDVFISKKDSSRMLLNDALRML